MKLPELVISTKTGTLLDTFLRTPSHAALLAGPLGTGKTHIARHIAAELLAVDTAALENHGYFRTIRPEKGSITIEQIRSLLAFFRLKVPGPAAIKRVAIIEDADAMGHEAQNALLKQLEEPPLDSVLILTSSQSDHLLPTIRSRTRILQLGQPNPEQLRQHFISQGYDKELVAAALLRSGENVAAAAMILSGQDDTADAVNLVKQALSGSAYERMLLVDTLARQKPGGTVFADTLATIAMASLQAAAAKGSASLDRWKQILSAVNIAQEALEHNGNAKLVLTELMLEL